MSEKLAPKPGIELPRLSSRGRSWKKAEAEYLIFAPSKLKIFDLFASLPCVSPFRFSAKILLRIRRGKLSRAFLTPEFLELALEGNAEEHRGEIFLARKIEGAKGQDWQILKYCLKSIFLTHTVNNIYVKRKAGRITPEIEDGAKAAAAEGGGPIGCGCGYPQ